MPEPKQPPQQKPVAPPEKKPAAPPTAAPKPKTPAQEKDDALKYEMQYANGGFNNGVEIKPDKDGKVQLKVSIYGGGEQKVMKISPMPAPIAKLMKAYELTATQNDTSTPEVTEELQKYFDQLRNTLSAKIIQIMTEADSKIKGAIHETFKSMS